MYVWLKLQETRKERVSKIFLFANSMCSPGYTDACSISSMALWRTHNAQSPTVYGYSSDIDKSTYIFPFFITKLIFHQVPVGLPLSFMGYGAVVPGGYGVSYNPTSDDIIFCICRYFWTILIQHNVWTLFPPASIPVLKPAAESLPPRFNNLYRSNKDV